MSVEIERDLARQLANLDNAILDSDASKIQWGKVLSSFLDLPFDRQIAAAKNLKTGQLTGMIEVAQKAKEHAITATYDNYLAMMREDGISIDSLNEYLESKAKPRNTSRGTGHRTPEEVTSYIAKNMHLAPAEQHHHINNVIGYDLGKQRLYNLRNRYK